MTSDDTLRWLEAGGGDQNVAAWLRSAAFASDGTVFIPAAIAGSAADAVLSAAYDGVRIVLDRGHAYVPADWLGREYPHAAFLAEKIEHRTRGFFASCS